MFQGSLLLEEDVAIDDCVVFYTDRRWAECLEEWKTARVWGLDIETYGLDDPRDGLNPWKGAIRLIQIALPSQRCMILDLGGIDGCHTPQHIIDEFLSILKVQLKSRYYLTAGHNLKFDLLYLMCKYGMEARGTRDTMLLSQLYWAGISGKYLEHYRHGLKWVAARLGFGEVDKSQQTSEWWQPQLTNKQYNYAAKDSIIGVEIFYKLGDLIKDAGMVDSARIECEALPGFVEMEYWGMPADIEMIENYIKKWEKVADDIIEPFLKDFPGENPNGKDLHTKINEKYKLKKPLAGTSKDDLAPLRKYPALKALSYSRTVKKHIDQLYEMKTAYFDERIRGIYQQQMPEGFGRSTCSGVSAKEASRNSRVGVNLQNRAARVPDDLVEFLTTEIYPDDFNGLGEAESSQKAKEQFPFLRECFRPKKGRAFVSGDLSSAHARIAAEISKDETLLHVYNNNLDMHCFTASTIAKLQGKDETWTPENMMFWVKDKNHPNNKEAKYLRKISKPSYYGFQNGQGGGGLQLKIKTDADVDVSLKEAKELTKATQQTYAGVHNTQKQAVEDTNNRAVDVPDAPYKYVWRKKDRGGNIVETEQITSTIYGVNIGLSGRRLYMPLRKSDYGNHKPSAKLSDCASFLWTSTEADISKLAIVGFLMDKDEHPEWDARLGNIAHDELDSDCLEDYALEVAKSLQANMQAAMSHYVKCIPVDEPGAKPESLIMKSWAEH